MMPLIVSGVLVLHAMTHRVESSTACACCAAAAVAAMFAARR